MAKSENRKVDEFHLAYVDDAILVGTHQLPQLKPQHHVPHDIVSFSERSSVTNPAGHWLDFFIDDYRFSALWRALSGCVLQDDSGTERFWSKMSSYLNTLRAYDGVIATDFSMYPEMLPDQRNWNCARNRIVAHYLEASGIPTIPVASWCTYGDFEWCFDGLASESTVAVSTNGCKASPESRRIFIEGISELVKQKNPWLLVVCGREIPGIKDVCDNVLCYPAFSQRMQQRVHDGR